MNSTKNTALISDKKYCIWCGNEINPDSKFCTKCGKKQIDKENQLVDWLIKHTKDKLKGDAEASLFDAVKNFLLSHLYGTVMSIAIIAAAGITVYASEPYINKFSANEVPSYISNSAVNNNTQYNQQMNEDVHDICNEYLLLINNVGGEYYDGGTVSVDHLLAPAGFEYGGNYSVVADERFESSISQALVGKVSKTVFEPSEFTMAVSKKMADNGYTVGECKISQEVEDMVSADTMYTREMIFSCVLIDDTWYIAENQIISLYENEEYANQIVIDNEKIVSVVKEYVYALLNGEDLTSYHFEIPADVKAEPTHAVYRLAEECDDMKSVEARVTLSHEGSSLPIAVELEEMGYTIAGANVYVEITTQLDRFVLSSHNFAFVLVNDEYIVLDDTIESISHSG